MGPFCVASVLLALVVSPGCDALRSTFSFEDHAIRAFGRRTRSVSFRSAPDSLRRARLEEVLREAGGDRIPVSRPAADEPPPPRKETLRFGRRTLVSDLSHHQDAALSASRFASFSASRRGEPAATRQRKPAASADGQDLVAIERRLQEAVRRAPASFEAHHNLGEFYIQHDRLEAAIPHLERSQAIDPSHYVNGHDLALAYLRTGRPSQARQQIQRLLQTKDTAELHNLLGDVEEGSGNLLAAAEEYQRAAHMDPTEENLFDWGNNLLQLRAYQPATEVLSEAVKRHPRSARLQVGLGIAHYSRGQFEDAIRAFCAAADLEPGDERPYLFLGEMYGVSAELAPEVTKRLARFVERQPGHALGHFFYAMSVWKGAGGAVPPPDVQVHLKKAVALDPRLAKAHFQLGVLYSDERRYPEAVSALKEAARLDPSMAQAHYRLAQAYRRTGREDLAAKALEAFERLQPH